jgi:hypothetical protein
MQAPQRAMRPARVEEAGGMSLINGDAFLANLTKSQNKTSMRLVIEKKFEFPHQPSLRFLST